MKTESIWQHMTAALKLWQADKKFSLLLLMGLGLTLTGCAIPQQRADIAKDYPSQPFLANIGQCKSCFPDTGIEAIALQPSFTLESIYFQSNRSHLRRTAKAKIDSIIAAIQLKHPQVVLIEGHADSRAGDLYNQALSERRANAVRDALVSRGIETARIISRGYGESRPAANNYDSLGRQRNRRVEIFLQ